MHFATTGSEPPQAALFRVAVSELGDVRYSMLQRSSGDTALDEQARQTLALCRFSPVENRKSKIENDLVWGTASVQWGNDVAPPVQASPDQKKTP